MTDFYDDYREEIDYRCSDSYFGDYQETETDPDIENDRAWDVEHEG